MPELGRQDEMNHPASVLRGGGTNHATPPQQEERGRRGMEVRRWVAREGGRQSETNHPTPPTSPPYPIPLPLRGQLDELCAAISQNNPTCFELTWGFALEGCPQAVAGGKSGEKTSHNSSGWPRTCLSAPERPPGGVAPRFTVHRGPSLEERVPVRGASRAIAGALSAASPKPFEARR